MNNPLYSLTTLLAPDRCLGCQAEGSLLCITCRSGLPQPLGGCFYCGRPTLRGATCVSCRAKTPLAAISARTVYTNPLAKQLLWKLKFDRSRAAAIDVANCLMTALPAINSKTIIVPVPTANRRVRARGYDQAVLIARHLAKLSGLPYRQSLVRLSGKEQKGAGRDQRFAQQQAALMVARPALVHGHQILLVDDVVTTGATLEAAALALHRAGAAKISAVVFAAA